jgi:predicted CXXCH cytochrome family protein
MKHLIRAGGIFAAVIFFAFVFPHLLPTSQVEGLQSYGFYTGHNNSTEWKQLPVQYQEPVQCNQCHSDKYSAWVISVHQSVSCENCHGSGTDHIEKGDPLVVNTSTDLCTACHSQVVGRPASFPQVDTTKHGKGLLCISCHNPHSPTIPGVPHQIEGNASCLSCHAADGVKPYPKDHAGRKAEFCLSCHQPE